MMQEQFSDEMVEKINNEIKESIDKVKSNFSVMKIKKYYMESDKGRLVFVSFGTDKNNQNEDLLSAIFSNNYEILKHIDKDITKFLAYRDEQLGFMEYKLNPFLTVKPNANLHNHSMGIYHGEKIYFDYNRRFSFVERIKSIFGIEPKLNWLHSHESIDSIFDRVRTDLKLGTKERIYVFDTNFEE